MGYCPQFDGLQPNMTGREHRSSRRRFEGSDATSIGVVNRLVRKMSLEKYADRAKRPGGISENFRRRQVVGEPRWCSWTSRRRGWTPRLDGSRGTSSARARAGALSSRPRTRWRSARRCATASGSWSGARFRASGASSTSRTGSARYSGRLRFQAGHLGARPRDEAIAAENLPGMEVVEAHQTELKLRGRKIRAGNAAPSSPRSKNSEPPPRRPTRASSRWTETRSRG